MQRYPSRGYHVPADPSSLDLFAAPLHNRGMGQGRAITAELAGQIGELLLSGLRGSEARGLLLELGQAVSLARVTQEARALGIELKQGGGGRPVGALDSQPRALRSAHRARARQLFARGWSGPRIARRLGITPQAVYQLLARP